MNCTAPACRKLIQCHTKPTDSKNKHWGTKLHSFPQLSHVVVWSKSWHNAYFLAFHCTNKNLIFWHKNSSNQMSHKSRQTLIATTKKHVGDTMKTSTECQKKLFHFPSHIWSRIDRFSHAHKFFDTDSKVVNLIFILLFTSRGPFIFTKHSARITFKSLSPFHLILDEIM